MLGKAASLSAALNRVEYCIPVEEWTDLDDLNNSLKNIMEAGKLETERKGKNEVKQVDIRPAIYELKIDGDFLVMTLGLGEGGYTRPTEVVEFLGRGLVSNPVALPFHRRAMYRLEDDRKIDPLEI